MGFWGETFITELSEVFPKNTYLLSPSAWFYQLSIHQPASWQSVPLSFWQDERGCSLVL